MDVIKKFTVKDNKQQSDYWNGAAGQRWVTFSDRLDAMLSPFADLILEASNIKPDETVLDIGCGGGALSLRAAEAAQSVLGVDISKPLIRLAQKRAAGLAQTNFHCEDAATISLDEKRDVVLSRFGVMFFSDPVSAFDNIRKQVKPDGRMVFACWQSPAKNLWAKAPLEAAMPFFKKPPTPPQPRAPGPFAFADAKYLTDILIQAGWKTVELTDWTGEIRLPGEAVEQTAAFMMEMGPLSKIVKDQELDKKRVQTALTEKLSRAANDDGTVDMQASVWIVKAGLG